MKPDRPITRRRVLHIAAAAGGLALAGGGIASLAQARRLTEPQRWQGTALGAQSTITLYHDDAHAGVRLIEEAVAELDRLERIFSLYQAESHLSRLNRDGRLEAPPMELVQLLAEARSFSERTSGAFDVTVQPLWSLYAKHFADPGADPSGPPDHAVRRARDLVDYRALEIDTDLIAFRQPGMAVTLNGIAQGWITDRIADLLRAAGLEDLLVNLGEIRAVGSHPDGRPWTVGLRDPFSESGLARTITLGSAALATSGGYGCRFDSAGRHHHLFDPHSGRSAERYASVSVMASTATAADALSTGIAGMAESDIPAVGQGMPGFAALVTRSNGTSLAWPKSESFTGRAV